MIIFLFSFWLATFSAPHAAAADFSKYPTAVENMSCHALDFDSYFKAQQFKSNILRDHPPIDRPNFAGHYLILKNEFVLETIWLIADCTTGKFFHETLSGNLKFQLDSNLAILAGRKPSDPIEYDAWSGKDWVQVEDAQESPAIFPTPNADTATQQPTLPIQGTHLTTSPFLNPPVSPGNALSNYENLYAQYPAVVAPTPLECHRLDYDSYFRAHDSKDSILKKSLDLQHPNFGGHYLLVPTDAIFEKVWLVADCASGKFLAASFTGNAHFTLTSNLVLMNTSGNFPKLLVLADDEWIQIPDPIQNKNQKISNALGPRESKKLFQNLPNEKHDLVLRRNDLICGTPALAPASSNVRPYSCTVKKDADAAATEIPAELSQQLGPLLSKWGSRKSSATRSESKIDSLRCALNDGKYTCDLTTLAW